MYSHCRLRDIVVASSARYRMQDTTDCKNYAARKTTRKFEQRRTKLHSRARSAVREFRVHCAGSSRYVDVASRTVFVCTPRVCYPLGGVPYKVAQKFRQGDRKIQRPVRRFKAYSQYIPRGIDVVRLPSTGNYGPQQLCHPAKGTKIRAALHKIPFDSKVVRPRV